MRKMFNSLILFVLIIGVVMCCTACGSNSDTDFDDVPVNDTETSKYLDDILYSGNSRRETVYGGTVEDRFKFQDDGTVTWGQCYSATGKCLGLSYTYKKDGLDVTIYEDDGDVIYTCYLNDSADTIKCKHSVDVNHYGFISYYKEN